MPEQLKQKGARKRFGQNFLTDEAVIERIAQAVNPHSEEHLVEIGPGRGALTAALVASGCQLDAVELDKDLTTGLLAAFSIYPNFTLHRGDALQFDFAALATDVSGGAKAAGLRVVGNLPYNISTPLIFRLLDQGHCIQDMHFMLQREVVERLAATPGDKHWGRLGILTQYQCEVAHLFDVPPEAFHPRPKVQSAVVRLTPHRQSPWPACNTEKLRAVVQRAFATRRKTLRNNLKGLIDSNQLEALGINPSARAETLTLTEFIQITERLHD